MAQRPVSGLRGQGYMKKGGAQATVAANEVARAEAMSRAGAPGASVAGPAVAVRGSAPLPLPSFRVPVLTAVIVSVVSLVGDVLVVVTR